jgi:hypothetical protein
MVVHAPVRLGCPAERARIGVGCLSASLRRSPITGACCWAAFGPGGAGGGAAGIAGGYRLPFIDLVMMLGACGPESAQLTNMATVLVAALSGFVTARGQCVELAGAGCLAGGGQWMVRVSDRVSVQAAGRLISNSSPAEPLTAA